MATLLSFDMAKISTWQEVMTPGFFALLLAHLGTVIAAFVGGVLIPASRDTTQRTRTTDMVALPKDIKDERAAIQDNKEAKNEKSGT